MLFFSLGSFTLGISDPQTGIKSAIFRTPVRLETVLASWVWDIYSWVRDRNSTKTVIKVGAWLWLEWVIKLVKQIINISSYLHTHRSIQLRSISDLFRFALRKCSHSFRSISDRFERSLSDCFLLKFPHSLDPFQILISIYLMIHYNDTYT